MGAMIGYRDWMMPMRVALGEYQYLSDWLWKEMATHFHPKSLCCDGQDGSSVQEYGLSDYKRRYALACDGQYKPLYMLKRLTT